MATAENDRKVILTGAEAQEKLSNGVNFGADIVASTLGSAGRNVIIERKNRTPIVVDDGITAINNVILDDEIENLGVSSLVDCANKQSRHAGDGTSTAIVLTRAIYEAGKKLIGIMGFGKTPFQIKNELELAEKVVINKIKTKSKPIQTKEEIKSVAIAAYNDEEMAETVANMVERVGENGIILVEEGWGRETETEVIEGMRFAGKLPHPLFSNTPEEGLSLDGLPILVTDFDYISINDLNDLNPIVMEAAKTEQGIIIIGNKFEKMFIEQVIKINIMNAQNRVSFRIWLVKTPSFTPGEFEDFATFVGGRYFSKEKSDKVIEATIGELGKASNLKITKEGDGICLGGAGTKEDIGKRIMDLKLRLAEEKVEMIKGRLTQRIACLASSFGIIKVASPSDGETEHIRLKVKNVVKSCQSAVAEGAVRGGGLALKEISDELEEGNILKEALKAPYEIIQRNSGGKLEIPEDLFDSAKVIRTAVEQACSQALMLINTDTAIAFKSQTSLQEAARIIAEGVENIKVGGRKVE